MGTRSLSRQAREFKVPPLPVGLRTRVLNGLAAGERVIVPVADPLVQVWPWKRLLWVGAGILIVIGGVRFVFDNRLYSESSALEFTPAEPSAGDEITVTYHASSQLGSETELRLRAQYRRAGDPPSGRGPLQIRTALLGRESDRTYRARLRLPPDVVYATFAVEDESGEVVDHRGRMGWQLLVHANGRPRYDALLQRIREAVGSDLGEALESADEATQLYQDRVEAWSIRGALEQEAYGPEALDSLRTVYAQRVHAFDDALGRTPVSADLVGAMYLYAAAWSTADVEERWRQRVLRDAPRSPIAVQLRTYEILGGHKGNPHEALRLLDSLYEDVGAVHASLPTEAFAVAYRMRDPDASLRWARRLIAVEPRQLVLTAAQLLSFPSLRDTVRGWIDGEIKRLNMPDDRDRPLLSSRSRYRQSIDSARFDLLGLKGQALLAMGDTLEARAYLDSAVAHGWDIDRFRAAEATRLAAGDTVGAAQLLARIAVDPGAADDKADKDGRLLLNASEWEAARDRARSDMLRETQREAEPHTLFDAVRVTRRLGDAVDLRETFQGHVTVVAFWYPPCRACLADLEELRNLVAGLPGAPRLTIVSRGPLEAADWTMLDDAGLASFVAVDGKDEAMQAFGVWGTAGVFVVGANGVIRYHYARSDDLARYVMALVPMQNAVAAHAGSVGAAAPAQRP